MDGFYTEDLLECDFMKNCIEIFTDEENKTTATDYIPNK